MSEVRLQIWTTHSWDLSGRGAARAEDARGTPTQSHISSSIHAHEEKHLWSNVGSGKAEGRP